LARKREGFEVDVWTHRPGWLLEAPGNRRPRGMAVTHAKRFRVPSRTRLIDWLMHI